MWREKEWTREQFKAEIFEHHIYCPDHAPSFNIWVSSSRNLWPARGMKKLFPRYGTYLNLLGDDVEK